MRNRVVDAAKHALSLEGLVVALIGGGVWAIAAAGFTQIPKFGVAASVAAGAGVGLLAVAAFIWSGVMPRRAQEEERVSALRAQEQERVTVLKSSARHDLRALTEEGIRKWTGVTLVPSEGRLEWQRRVYSFLLDAFGKETAEAFSERAHVRSQTEMLSELDRSLDEIDLRSGYRGWHGQGG